MTTAGRIKNGKVVGKKKATAKQKAAFADMLASQSPPRGMTDDLFLSGQGTLDKQFRGDEAMLSVLTKNAVKQGYRPKASDVYCGALAENFGDPKAFLPHGARGHIKKVCEATGRDCDGSVKARYYSEPLRDPLEGHLQITDIPIGGEA